MVMMYQPLILEYGASDSNQVHILYPNHLFPSGHQLVNFPVGKYHQFVYRTQTNNDPHKSFRCW